MYAREGFADLRPHAPAESAADHAGAEVVETVVGVPLHDREILGYVIQEHVERGGGGEVGSSVSDGVVENPVGTATATEA